MEVSSMQDFEQVFPTPDALNDVGVKRLKAAILLQAAEDLYYGETTELNDFLNSEWFNSLTDISPKDFRREIRFWIMRGKSVKDFISRWKRRLEEDEAIDTGTYYDPQMLTELLQNQKYYENCKIEGKTIQTRLKEEGVNVHSCKTQVPRAKKEEPNSTQDRAC
jgi:hypothetical protein